MAPIITGLLKFVADKSVSLHLRCGIERRSYCICSDFLLSLVISLNRQIRAIHVERKRAEYRLNKIIENAFIKIYVLKRTTQMYYLQCVRRRWIVIVSF